MPATLAASISDSTTNQKGDRSQRTVAPARYTLLRCMSPQLALRRHGDVQARRLLSVPKRTWGGWGHDLDDARTDLPETAGSTMSSQIFGAMGRGPSVASDRNMSH